MSRKTHKKNHNKNTELSTNKALNLKGGIQKTKATMFFDTTVATSVAKTQSTTSNSTAASAGETNSTNSTNSASSGSSSISDNRSIGGTGSVAIKKAMQRLHDNGLIGDTRIVKLVIDNPGYENRLVNLFIKLNQLSFIFSDQNFEIIVKNVPNSGQLVDILETMESMKIDPHSFTFPQLFNAAQSNMEFKLGLEEFRRGGLSQDILSLMMQYPSFASDLAELKLKLNDRGYGLEPIERLLNALDKSHIPGAIHVLMFAIKNNVYFPYINSVLLKEQNALDSVLEGAKKLAELQLLSEAFFTGVYSNPDDANVTAKMMILLQGAEIIDCFDSETIKSINELGRGAYFLMDQLDSNRMLDTTIFSMLCHEKRGILKSPEIIDAFTKIPLFDRLSQNELNNIVNILASPQVDTTQAIDEIQKILHGHHLEDPLQSDIASTLNIR